jgi:hypothetical protein
VIVVAEAGPLLHLHWVGASEWALPPQPIQVVDAVWAEVTRHAPDALRIARLVRAGTPSAETRAPLAQFAFDEGETDALAYALSSGSGVVLLCDETAARQKRRRPAQLELSLSLPGRRPQPIKRGEGSATQQ